MSTKNQTTGSNATSFQFDPGSLSAYQKNLGQFLPFAQNLFQNPFGNQMFAKESAINQDQAMNMGQRAKSNVLNNAAAMGYSTNGGMFNSLLNQAGRYTGNLQAQGFRSSVMNANQRAMQGLGISSAFQPLMTGSNSNFTQTQTQSGLGTWLPQVAGMALGAATAGMTGGMGGAGSMLPAAGAAGSSGWNWGGGVIGSIPGVGNSMPGGLPNLFPPTSGGSAYTYGR